MRGRSVHHAVALRATSRAPAYRRREPEHTALYAVLQRELETFLARAAPDERLPAFIERELRAFLRCGILSFGFARVHCDGCGHDRLVAFSCKGRGFCPSCGGKRMTRFAEHLIDHVLPVMPVRQWVLTVRTGFATAWPTITTSAAPSTARSRARSS